MLAVLADLARAFPRVWRALVPSLAAGCLSTSQLQILSDLLSWNHVLIAQGGSTVVRLIRGLAEGGYLGSLFYPLLPNVLLKKLDQLQLGPSVAPYIGTKIPPDSPCDGANAGQLQAYDDATQWCALVSSMQTTNYFPFPTCQPGRQRSIQLHSGPRNVKTKLRHFHY